MKHDELDRLLSIDDVIVPSAGFASSVMETVMREAATPAPLPFPWRRALPGIIGLAAALIAALCGSIVMIWRLVNELPSHPFERAMAAIADATAGDLTSWLALATLVVTITAVTNLPAMLSERLPASQDKLGSAH